jgi:hypothetical protein
MINDVPVSAYPKFCSSIPAPILLWDMRVNLQPLRPDFVSFSNKKTSQASSGDSVRAASSSISILRLPAIGKASGRRLMPGDVMRYAFNWALLKRSPGGGNQVKQVMGLKTLVDVWKIQ